MDKKCSSSQIDLIIFLLFFCASQSEIRRLERRVSLTKIEGWCDQCWKGLTKINKQTINDQWPIVAVKENEWRLKLTSFHIFFLFFCACYWHTKTWQTFSSFLMKTRKWRKENEYWKKRKKKWKIENKNSSLMIREVKVIEKNRLSLWYDLIIHFGNRFQV